MFKERGTQRRLANAGSHLGFEQRTSRHLLQTIARRRPDLGLNSTMKSVKESLAPCARTEGKVSMSRLERRCHKNVGLQGLVQSAVL